MEPNDTIEEDAVLAAKKLLVFYVGEDVINNFHGQWSTDEKAREVLGVPSIDGMTTYRVFEIWGYVGKARYRMRLFYKPMHRGSFLLMGDEIMEDA